MRGRRVLFILAASLAMGLSFPIHAQQQPPPVFRSGTDLVRLDVRVTDDRGAPVADLRADEIEVIEDGRVHPLLLFQRVEGPSASYVEVARRTVAGEVSTNQGSARGHLYALVFDQNHLTSGNEQRARAAAERFLRAHVRPGDRVALFAIPGPGPHLEFSASRERAIAELPKIRGSLERRGQGGIGPMRVQEAYEITRGNAEVLTRVSERLSLQAGAVDTLVSASGLPSPGRAAVGDGDATQHRNLVHEEARGIVARADTDARRFLATLSDILIQFKSIDGRKSLVLFSEGFYTDHVSRELEQVAASAAQSYTVVHAFDLNRRGTDLQETEPIGGDQYAEIQSRLASLGSLAAETSGTLVVDAASRLDAALDSIATESLGYYLLGFSPDIDGAGGRGEYRRVQVRVKRPGLRVTARTGYAATRSQPTPADRRLAIDAAFRAPFPQQGVRVQYTTYVLRGSTPGVQRVFMSLAADLPVSSPAAKPVDVVFVVRNARDGQVAASGTDVMPLPSAARPGTTMGTGLFKVQFDLAPGEYLMRAVVREPGGLLGSADRRFQVRPLTGSDIRMSDLVLGDPGGALPVRAVAYSKDGLAGVMELYGSTPQQLEDVSVTMELSPLGAERATMTTAADLQGVREDGGSVSRPVRLLFPLTSVASGEYVVTATVRAAGEQVGSVVREVTIVEGQPPGAAAPPPSSPVAVLQGDVTRRYLGALGASAATAHERDAARLALAGEWRRVAGALGPPHGGESATGHGLRGLAAFAQHDFAQAAAQLRLALTRDAGNALTAFLLGWAHEVAGNRREALSAWRSAVFLDPLLVSAHLALADGYLKLEEPALAIQALRAGLTAVPQSPELLDKLAMLQRHP